MKVSIVVLFWNNDQDTIDCLQSLKNVQYSDFDVLVVDNGSESGFSKKVQEWVENNGVGVFKFFRLNNNLGFSGGNNFGIRVALDNKVEYILVLNNDTVVVSNFLSELMSSAKQVPDLGILGCRINYWNDKDKVWFAGGTIDIIKGGGSHKVDNFSHRRSSDYVTGCVMLIPAHVIEKVGLFDDRFFLNWEDADISFRIKNSGYKLMVEPNALVYHKVSVSQGGYHTPLHQYYMHRNRLLFFSNNFPGYFPIFLMIQIFLRMPIYIAQQLLKGEPRIGLFVLYGYLDFIRSRFGRCSHYLNKV